MTYKTDLLLKIKSNKAKIGIIGLGYVGLPLACAFAKKNKIKTNLIHHAGKINSQMPSWIITNLNKNNIINNNLIDERFRLNVVSRDYINLYNKILSK